MIREPDALTALTWFPRTLALFLIVSISSLRPSDWLGVGAHSVRGYQAELRNLTSVDGSCQGRPLRTKRAKAQAGRLVADNHNDQLRVGCLPRVARGAGALLSRGCPSPLVDSPGVDRASLTRGPDFAGTVAISARSVPLASTDFRLKPRAAADRGLPACACVPTGGQ